MGSEGLHTNFREEIHMIHSKKILNFQILLQSYIIRC